MGLLTGMILQVVRSYPSLPVIPADLNGLLGPGFWVQSYQTSVFGGVWMSIG